MSLSPSVARRSLSTFALALSIGALSACTGMQTDGDPEPEVCEGEGELSIAPGETGTTFVPFQPGDILPTWDRPQGGIGTRINVKLKGLAPGDPVDLIQTIIVRPLDGPPGGVGENGGECAVDLEGNKVCNDEELSCILDSCREVITDQVNRQFPTECQNGSLIVTEMPIRFRTRVELNEVDGAMGELFMRLDLDDSDDEYILSDTVEIEMDVGDFIQPSWWED